MYLNHYYNLKGQYLLVDKNYLFKRNLEFSNKTYLKVNINTNKKKDKIILFLMINFMNMVKSKNIIESSFIFKGKYELFLFFNNFILIWLVFSLKLKNIFLFGGSNKKNIIFSVKSIPFLVETEKLIEINDKYIQSFKDINLTLIIFKQFINYNHKESFSRLLKLPVIR